MITTCIKRALYNLTLVLINVFSREAIQMKQKQISILAASLVAAFAANVASAGQIQSSSVSIAREVITTDTQVVTTPSIAYRFAGDVDARVQDQTFQVQFKLQSGKFASSGTGAAVSVSDGISAAIINQDPTNAQAAAINYRVDAIGLDAAKTTAFVTITVRQSPTALIKQPLISFGVTANTISNVAGTNVSANRATINGLYTVVGDIVDDFNTKGICLDNKQAKVEFFHYTALSSPLSIATGVNATADEHTRSGATNTATLITFPTNLLISVAASTGDAKVSPLGANLVFAGSATGTPAFVNATLINLGKVTIAQNSTGYDSNLANQYLMAPGIVQVATATVNNGPVEAQELDIKVSAPNGFDVGSSVYLSTTANCAAAIAGSTVAIVAGNAAGPVTPIVDVTQLTATLGAAGTNPVYVCYGVNGVATPIPLTSFSAVATLVKAAAGANLNEQNNVCNGLLYSLGGGVKIDVRNFISDKTPGGWMSVIRLINNSESRAIDIYGQMIYADGSYGAYGLLTQGLAAGTTGGAANKLGPRATLNLNSAQIAALLNTAPAHATAALNNAAGAATVVNGGAQRLRITSNTGSTLRVQNYITDGKTFLEASGQQGVDFEGSTDRAPASEGQYQDQDAFKGLNGK